VRFKLRKKLSEYRVIILDMDGTLYYQFPLRVWMSLVLFWYYLFHPMRIKELSIFMAFRKLRESECLIYSDDFEKQQYEILSERFHVTPEIIKEIVDRWMQEKALKYVHLFRDKKLLKYICRLKNNGTKLVLYSDYPVEKKLQALFPLEVDYCFCALDKEIGCLKPNPKGIRHIVKTVDEPVEQIVFIGDRYKKDGKSAESVGMDYLILDRNPIKKWRRLRNQYKLKIRC
jgi:HAD superfamily hydrolase (TIGR01549 family)